MASPEQPAFPIEIIQAALTANAAAEVAGKAAVRATGEAAYQLQQQLPAGHVYRYRLVGDEGVCFPGKSRPRLAASGFSGKLVVGTMILIPSSPYVSGNHNHAHFYPLLVHTNRAGRFIGLREQQSMGITLAFGIDTFQSGLLSTMDRAEARRLAEADEILDPRSFPTNALVREPPNP